MMSEEGYPLDICERCMKSLQGHFWPGKIIEVKVCMLCRFAQPTQHFMLSFVDELPKKANMQLEITEEERELLEKLLIRAEVMARKGFERGGFSPMFIRELRQKVGKLDDSLTEKLFQSEGDNAN